MVLVQRECKYTLHPTSFTLHPTPYTLRFIVLERIARALRTTAVYLRCACLPATVRFFRAVIAAHSRAREYAAATPRRSTLQSLNPDPDPDPKRGQIGNVFPVPKKHRLRPHFDNNAERSPTVFGAIRDHPYERFLDDSKRILRLITYRFYR